MKKILLILSIFSSFAFADIEHEYKAEVEAIEAKLEAGGNGSLAAMEAAADEAYESYDKLLNKYYNKLMSVISEKSKKALKESQKEWIKFRDKERDFQNILYEREGQVWGLSSRMKRYRMIKHRVDELVDYLMTEDMG